MSVSIPLMIMLPKEAVMGSAGSGYPLLSPVPAGAQLCNGQQWWWSKAFLNFFFKLLSKFSFFQDFTALRVRKWEVAVPVLYQHKRLHLLKNACKKNWGDSHSTYCS